MVLFMVYNKKLILMTTAKKAIQVLQVTPHLGPPIQSK
jgi:hypothetical protein